VRGIREAKVLMSAKAAIHFDSGLKVLWTYIAALWPSGKRQRTTDADGIAKFIRCVLDVCFRDEILRERPTLEIAS